MAETWELILHHTYDGTPGLIVDRSPNRGSHGVVVKLGDADFLADGAGQGTGAIRFPVDDDGEPYGKIQVEGSEASWSPLEALRCQITCMFEPPAPAKFETLLKAEGFSFYTMDWGGFGATFDDAAGHRTRVRAESEDIPTPGGLPDNQWLTLGFDYDGVSLATVSYNGVIIKRAIGPLAPLPKATSIVIGENLVGRIDEIKVWRMNPHRVAQEFLDRPQTPEQRDCWRQWFTALSDALAADPECADRFRHQLHRVMRAVQYGVQTHSDASRERLTHAALRYRELWMQNELGELGTHLRDFLAWLETQGLDPKGVPEVQEMLADPCTNKLLASVPSMLCDPDYTAIFEAEQHG
jgi:hypothetical protein